MKLRVLSLSFFCISFLSAFAGQGVLYYKSGIYDIAKSKLKQELLLDNKAEACYYLGNIYFVENKKDSARFYFNEGLAANPQYMQNSIGLIMLDMNGSEPKQITSKMDVILKTNKKNIELPIAASYAFLYTNNIEQANLYQKLAQKINPKSPSLYLLKGDIVAGTNLGEACANYETAILYDANCVEAYFKYARVYKKMNPKQATDKLLSLKSISPDFNVIDRELGDIYYTTNDFANAAKYYEMYLKSGSSTNVADLTKYGMTLFLNHEFVKSLEVVKLGLQKSERNPAFNRLAMYNNVDLKNTDEALKAADLFFNKSEKPDFSYLDFRYYGQALKDAKKFDLAVVQYQKALEYDATKVELWKDVSDMYSELGKFGEAITSYKKYQSQLPEKQQVLADVKIALGKLYYSQGNDSTASSELKQSSLMTADSIFAAVALIEPGVYRANFWRARANAALDPETTLGLAKPYYDLTVALVAPKNDARFNSVLVECYSYLGYFTMLKKEYSTSLEYWNKILVINPANTTAKKAIAGIQVPKKK